MTLPEPARRRIFKLVYRATDGIKVDVVNDTSIHTGLLTAFGRDFYNEWRDKYLLENDLTISATTTGRCMAALNSTKFERILREIYHPTDHQDAIPKAIE
jgi:hypothetical protein